MAITSLSIRGTYVAEVVGELLFATGRAAVFVVTTIFVVIVVDRVFAKAPGRAAVVSRRFATVAATRALLSLQRLLLLPLLRLVAHHRSASQ